MDAKRRIPILILTGFLGSGKTVLLNSLLGQAGFADSAVIVNEFGEIGLDHLLVTTGQDNIVLLDSGCLCCAILGSLRETLADLHHRRARGEIPPFQRVLIETTGLADPAPILQSIMRDPVVSHSYHLGGVICLVDALHGEAQLDQHAEARAQIGFADRMLLTKTDRLDGVAPERLVAKMQALNPTAELLVVSRGEVTADALLSSDAIGEAPPWLGKLAMPDTPSPNRHDHHDHPTSIGVHDASISAESFFIGPAVSWSGLAAWIDAVRRLYGTDLLRCKGIMKVAGVTSPVVLHGVQTMFDTRRLSAWPDDERRSRLVLIGRGLKRQALEDLLPWLFLPEGSQPPLNAQATPPLVPCL